MLRLFSLLFVAYVTIQHTNAAYNMVQPRNRALFDGLTCSTCEGVMTSVAKQIPDVTNVGKEALKMAIKGACAFYTLGIPVAIPLCNVLGNKLGDYIAADILGRTMSVNPKSNCRSVGMCPPCNVAKSKLVLAKKNKPNLPLPWDNHNKNQHVQMVAKYESDLKRRQQLQHQQFVRNMTLSPARQKAILDGVKCYACKSVLGLVAHDITNVKQATRDMLITTVKTSCKSYSAGLPFSGQVCDIMADKMVGNLADDIMGKAEVKPVENCRKIQMCPECKAGQKCDEDEEIEQGKKAAEKGQTPLPDTDAGCDEPPVNDGKPCSDNQERCKSNAVTCDSSIYQRMMRMECMFTCVCSWLPWFSGK